MTSSRPVLVDLFCGAGGASMGYHRAGFDVIGVDIEPQPRYPFTFVQADALEVAANLPANAVAVHASPPCQRYSRTANMWPGREHPDLIHPTREALIASGLPWVIENVVGAPLRQPVMLCGSSFGLDVRRHRLFESTLSLLVPPCQHGWQTPRFPTQLSTTRAKVRRARLASVVSVAGNDSAFYPSPVVHVHGSAGGKGGVELWRHAMGIDWMTRPELAQAIPPVFTELIGHQLLPAALELAS